MSGPKGNEPRGFLGTDELDLDAWDATFDALHVPGEPAPLQAEPGPETPAPGGRAFAFDVDDDFASIHDDEGATEASPDLSLPADDRLALDATGRAVASDAASKPDEVSFDAAQFIDFADIDEDAARSTEPAVPEVPARPFERSTRVTSDTVNSMAAFPPGDDAPDDVSDDLGEDTPVVEIDGSADFGDDNTVELGDAVMLAEFHNFEEAARRSLAAKRTFAAVVPRNKADAERRSRTDISKGLAPVVDDADVYTSAARPKTSNDIGAPRIEVNPRIEKSEPRLEPAAPRTGRNVLARTLTPQTVIPRTITPNAVARRRRPSSLADAPSTEFPAQESTRIAGFGEMDASMSASRQRLSAAVIERAEPLPQPFDDDYADIDIEQPGSGAAGEPGETKLGAALPSAVVVPPAPISAAPAPPRRTAHVLRRRGPPTKPPPMADRSSLTEIVAEARDEASARHVVRDEDDFSDVASEVMGISAVRSAVSSPAIAGSPGGGLAATPSRESSRVVAAAQLPSATAPAVDLLSPQPEARELPATSQRSATDGDDDGAFTDWDSGRAPSDVGLDDLDDVTVLIETKEQSLSSKPPSPPSEDPIDPPTQVVDLRSSQASGVDGVVDDDDDLLSGLADYPTSAVIELRKPVARSEAPSYERAATTVWQSASPSVGSVSIPIVAPRVKTPTSVPALGSQSRERLTSSSPPGANLVFEALAIGAEPEINLEALSLPAQMAPLPMSGLDESFAQTLGLLEEDLDSIDDREGAATLRLEAGRLAECLGEDDRARGHYEAAVLADPRLAAAVRGLRRLALSAGDLGAATRYLDAELEVAGALERRPLGHYRADLLMAAAEQDLARVAVGEMLDAAPSDVRALIAQLELAYLDGRFDELGASLSQLAHAVSDPGLRAAAQTARAVLSTRPDLRPDAIGPLFLAAASDPSAVMSRLAAARYLVIENEPAAAAEAMTQVAFQIALADKDVAAALAVRALVWGPADGAVDLAASAAPADPIVAQTLVEAASPAEAAAALSRCADRAPSLARRSYLAGLAAEIDIAHASVHWAHVLAADPGDDYAAAQLRTSHVASDATADAIAVDLAASQGEIRERSRMRGGFGLAGMGQMDRAIEVLREGRRARPNSLPIAEALAEVYAQGALWRERAELFAEFASTPRESIDPELAAMRSALAWEDAAIATSGDPAVHARRQAVAAWSIVLEAMPGHPLALGALINLANALDDSALLRRALARVHIAERNPWRSSSMALRRARHAEFEDEGDELLRDAGGLGIDDPRRLTMTSWYAARRGDLDDVVIALDDRAHALDEMDPARSVEAASLRLRAAQIAVEANDPARAATLFASVGDALPTLSVVPDLLASARRRAGDQPIPTSVRRGTPAGGSGDEFARWVREADYLTGQGDHSGALGLYQRALDLHPHDPLATEPMRRLATAIGESGPIAALALSRLRHAESSGDRSAVADAYQVLADIDLHVRRDEGAAVIALESAAKADPSRFAVLRQLAQVYAARGQVADLLRIRRLQLKQVASTGPDSSALLFDIATLAERDGRGDDEIAEALAAALQLEPRQRLGLFQLEMLVRRKGPSPRLAALEEQISRYFDGDGRSVAAFLTRAAETLTEIGDIEAAIARFKLADEACAGHIPALRGWRLAALKGQLWLDVAESASREAEVTSDPVSRGALYHLAGVALMDKAVGAERALVPLTRTLAAVPSHRDAFLRLRILFEEDGRHEDLATLLERRLAVEFEVEAKVELHRAIADLHRNFLSDREVAKRHYRAILELRSDDLSTHGALSDIAWEQGEWSEAADSLIARSRLERDPAVLRTLYYRLGLIYADRLPDVQAALGWLQKALQFDPDDDATLVRLADLAASANEWKLALSACDRLVKNEKDPERRVAHLHRVARIFIDGLGDRKRAERALNLALDSTPTHEAARIELVRFYRAGNDATSIRVHLTRVAGGMRSRIESDPRDAIAYQVLSRTMTDRESAASPGSRSVAKIAAELALLNGGGGEAERRLVGEEPGLRLSSLLVADADDLLFPRTVQGELRQMFHLLGDRLAKHVGVDLRVYGAARGDRLRGKDSAVARIAQEVAAGLGFGEIDVYVSSRLPWVYATEPTSPVSLILGKDLVAGSEMRIRFASAAALKLAAASLSIAARLPAEELGVLVVALVRLFHPEFQAGSVDPALVAAQVQKLRRLIPTSLVNDLRPYALSLDGTRLDPTALSNDLRSAGLRAGVVATQSIVPALELLAAGHDPVSALAQPLVADLLKFALGEDLVALSK